MLSLFLGESYMTSNEFVAGLAEVMGVERTELATVDRALAKRGFRQIARGRFRPDITLTEGLLIAVAWAGSKNLTLAADEVERLENFALSEDEPRNEVETDFINIFGGERLELSGRSFVDLLVRVARNLGIGKYEADKIWVSVVKQGGVDISFCSGYIRKYPRFMDFNKLELPVKGRSHSRHNVKVKVQISGVVLKWIFNVTEGE